MCNALCFIFSVLAINFVKSWDYAITSEDRIEFYTGTTRTSFENHGVRDLTAITYDAVHNMTFFVDRRDKNASIFSYNLTTKKIQPLVRKGPVENIISIAFDPLQKLLFWTDYYKRSIYSFNLKGPNSIYGNLLIYLDDQLPRGIAVDSCRGYIYWTNVNLISPSIERARFDGTERQTIISDNLYLPSGIFVDQQTKRIYWADDKEGIHYSIESSDLNGTPASRRTLHRGIDHQPVALTVSNDSIYWIDWGYKRVWKLSKDQQNAEPEELIEFKSNPFGIIANYTIADQVARVPECRDLLELSEISQKSCVQDGFCFHGYKIGVACECYVGYTGERCETHRCYNYCLHGDCTIDGKGEPICECQAGFTGMRCESYEYGIFDFKN